MPLPHHDHWLRDVLDQQFMGHSWPQVQRRFENVLAEERLCYYAWPVPRWAAPDKALDVNTASLAHLPFDVKVICPGSGPDGSVTLRTDLFLGTVSFPGQLVAMRLDAGTRINLEIGAVSPLNVWQNLESFGHIARFPYEIEGVDPHFFILGLDRPSAAMG